jgi:hypothetical protein
MMYRIINGLVAIEPPPFMHHLGAATRGQQHKYIVPYSRTTVHKESFFPSTIRLWNQLPEATAVALGRAAAIDLHTEFKTTMLAQGRDYVQLKTRSAVLESDCLDFLFG